jgi:hypothetical protein
MTTVVLFSTRILEPEVVATNGGKCNTEAVKMFGLPIQELQLQDEYAAAIDLPHSQPYESSNTNRR